MFLLYAALKTWTNDEIIILYSTESFILLFLQTRPVSFLEKWVGRFSLPKISNKYSCQSKRSLLHAAQKIKTEGRKGLWRHLWPERMAAGCVGSRCLPPIGSLQIKTALQLPLPPHAHYYWVMIHFRAFSQTAVYHYWEHKCLTQQS